MNSNIFNKNVNFNIKLNLVLIWKENKLVHVCSDTPNKSLLA